MRRKGHPQGCLFAAEKSAAEYSSKKKAAQAACISYYFLRRFERSGEISLRSLPQLAYAGGYLEDFEKVFAATAMPIRGRFEGAKDKKPNAKRRAEGAPLCRRARVYRNFALFYGQKRPKNYRRF